MKQSLVVQLEHTANERTYHLYLPVGAPLGEAYEACHAMLREVTKMAQDANDRAAKQMDNSSEAAAAELV
jgi:hypothetical protein